MTILICFLWAQQSADMVAAPSWWTYGIQGGSFGLLAYLAVYLGPKLLKEAQDERRRKEESNRAERETRDTKFENCLTMMQTSFEVRNDKLVKAIGAQTDKIITEMERSTDALTQLLVNSCNYPLGPTRPPRQHKHSSDESKP